jgi:outer membrane protein TolC
LERETRARLRAATASLKAKSDVLHAALEEELYAWREAQRLVVLNQESLVPHANQLLEATETAYRSGSASFWELVDTERSRLEFELKLERARTDQALSAARLDDLLGRSASPLEGRIR